MDSTTWARDKERVDMPVRPSPQCWCGMSLSRSPVELAVDGHTSQEESEHQQDARCQHQRDNGQDDGDGEDNEDRRDEGGADALHGRWWDRTARSMRLSVCC